VSTVCCAASTDSTSIVKMQEAFLERELPKMVGICLTNKSAPPQDPSSNTRYIIVVAFGVMNAFMST